jgi:hypothetical protein
MSNKKPASILPAIKPFADQELDIIDDHFSKKDLGGWPLNIDSYVEAIVNSYLYYARRYFESATKEYLRENLKKRYKIVKREGKELIVPKKGKNNVSKSRQTKKD